MIKVVIYDTKLTGNKFRKCC